MQQAAVVTPSTLPLIEFKKQPVVTTALLADLYGTNRTNIQSNFNRNVNRFTEDKHYYHVKGRELKELKKACTISAHVENDMIENSSLVHIGNRVNQLILWTERGAVRHAKMLDTDKAWEVFEELEEHYFNKYRKKPEPTPSYSPCPIVPRTLSFHSHPVRGFAGPQTRVPIVDIAKAIGYDRQAVLNMVNRDNVLKNCKVKATVTIPLKSGGTRDSEVNALTLEGLVGLLVKFNVSQIKDTDKRFIVNEFQGWVLSQLEKMSTWQLPSPAQSLSFPLTPEQQRRVQKWVADHVFHHIANGDEKHKAFKKTYSAIKDHFQVGSYKDVPAERFNELMEFIPTVFNAPALPVQATAESAIVSRLERKIENVLLNCSEKKNQLDSSLHGLDPLLIVTLKRLDEENLKHIAAMASLVANGMQVSWNMEQSTTKRKERPAFYGHKLDKDGNMKPITKPNTRR